MKMFLTAVFMGAILIASGCASGRENSTYSMAPSDGLGRQTPHSIP